MSENPPTATLTAAATDRAEAWAEAQQKSLRKRALLAAIGGKWDRFSEQELSDLKNEDDLARQLAAKYGLEEDIARRDIATLMDGRSFEAPPTVVRQGKVLPFRKRQSAGR